MTTTYTSAMKPLTLRARAFTGYGIEKIRAIVGPDGTVRVYDDVAGYYTDVHSLSERMKQKIRKLAGWNEPSAATRVGT